MKILIGGIALVGAAACIVWFGTGLKPALGFGTESASPSSAALGDQVSDLPSDDPEESKHVELLSFFKLTAPNPVVVQEGLKEVREKWHPGSATILVEIVRFGRSRNALQGTVELLEEKTGQKFGADFTKWNNWIWSQKYNPHPQYLAFKSQLYRLIDPRFEEYFREAEKATIRLDQVVWGGVIRDGIPPLKDPKMISVAEADYLADTDVVFGIDLNDDPRCYPKRILAWHEMFKDTIGGESVCGVY